MYYVYLNEAGLKYKRLEIETQFFYELQYTPARDYVMKAWLK